MPVLKFETKIINGKPNISFGTELPKTETKKRDYKDKSQKYSLRNRQSKEAYSSEINYKSHSEVTDEREIPKKFEQNKNERPLRLYQKDNVSGFNSNLNKVPRENTANSQRKLINFKSEKESLFNFLENDNEADKFHKKFHIKEEKSKSKDVLKKDFLNDNDIDEIMKQVVLENKNLLTEEQLVDILAKLYLEAKIGRKMMPIEIQENQNNPIFENKPKPLEEGSIFENSSAQILPSNKDHTSVPVTVPLTTIQKKQLQWEKERREMDEIVSYNPWGKPGCGAPTKSYNEVIKNETGLMYQESFQTKPSKVIQSQPIQSNTFSPENISYSELKRQQWLAELNEQVADKERLKMLEIRQQNSINNLTNVDSKMQVSMDTNGINHGRGKGLADLSQMSTDEVIIKRNKQLEQQEAIRKQIEEKEAQKRIERERKLHLDQEEEARVIREKLQLDAQFMSETARIKQQDDESSKRSVYQKLQLELAEKAALLDKKLKRLQRLEMSGHDTRQLRAGLIAEQMSGRLGDSFELRNDGNNLNKLISDKSNDQHLSYKSPRLFTQVPLTEDHAVQTDSNYSKVVDTTESEDFGHYTRDKFQQNHYLVTSKIVNNNKNCKNKFNHEMIENNSNKRRSSSVSSMKHNSTRKIKKPESIKDRKPWGRRKTSKTYIPQSKRDPFYSTLQDTRENHKKERMNRILAQVKANLDRIPDKDVHDGRLSQRHKQCEVHKRSDNDKENCVINNDTYELKDNSHFVFQDENRVNGNITYKDSYKKSNKLNHTSKYTNEQHEIRKSSESNKDWWSYQDHEIIRTTDVLNPAMADQILPISRENTDREKARHGYYKNLNPAQYGEPLRNQNDNFHFNNLESNKTEAFFQPQGHPTHRQNTILKQLSDIREGLLLKQKEIETSMSFNADM